MSLSPKMWIRKWILVSTGSRAGRRPMNGGQTDGKVDSWVAVEWMRTWRMEMGGGRVHQQAMNGVIGRWTVAVCMRVKSQACPSHPCYRPSKVLSHSSLLPQHSPRLHHWPAPQTAPCPRDQHRYSGPGVRQALLRSQHSELPCCLSASERLRLSELSL